MYSSYTPIVVRLASVTNLLLHLAHIRSFIRDISEDAPRAALYFIRRGGGAGGVASVEPGAVRWSLRWKEVDLWVGGNIRSMDSNGRVRCEDIRLRLTPQERADLLALRAASGYRTMVEFVMHAARLAAPAPVDRSVVAALSASVAALGAAPLGLRDLRAAVLELRDQIARLPVGEERLAVLGRVREILCQIDEAVERVESSSEPARSAARSAMEQIMEEVAAQGAEKGLDNSGASGSAS